MTRRKQVLVVDDDAQMVRTLCDILRLHGWAAESASSGEEAVRRVREDGYPLVLMDIKMGGMNGVDALEAIRAARPETRVILMTAYSASELVERAEQAGAVTVLAKPLAMPDLLRHVAEAASAPEPVLVVDDDQEFLRSLCDSLRIAGVTAHAAASLPEALAELERREYRVVLLDLRLDALSGSDCALAVKQTSPDVLLVLFSGFPEELRRTRAEIPDSWVVASLIKPFEPEALLAILEDVHVR